VRRGTVAVLDSRGELRWIESVVVCSYSTEGGLGGEASVTLEKKRKGRRSLSNGGAAAHGPNLGKDDASPVPMSGQTARWREREGGWSNFVAGLTQNRGKWWWSSQLLQC
jgi:hypothetical protein